MKLKTTKLLPETIRLVKQQAAARGVFMYEYLAELVKRDIEGEFYGLKIQLGIDTKATDDTP